MLLPIAVEREESYDSLSWVKFGYEIMNKSDIKYMIEGIVADLAELLSKDYGMSVVQALDTLYNSETYTKLTLPATGLFFKEVYMCILSLKRS